MRRDKKIKESEGQGTGWVTHRHTERGEEGPVEECSQSDEEVHNEWQKVDNKKGWGSHSLTA